jgi:hypothetical protein
MSKNRQVIFIVVIAVAVFISVQVVHGITQEKYTILSNKSLAEQYGYGKVEQAILSDDGFCFTASNLTDKNGYDSTIEEEEKEAKEHYKDAEKYGGSSTNILIDAIRDMDNRSTQEKICKAMIEQGSIY